MENLIGIREVAQKLGAKESTIRAWVFQRRIPHVRVGRLVKFRESEIEAWVEKENRN